MAIDPVVVWQVDNEEMLLMSWYLHVKLIHSYNDAVYIAWSNVATMPFFTRCKPPGTAKDQGFWAEDRVRRLCLVLLSHSSVLGHHQRMMTWHVFQGSAVCRCLVGMTWHFYLSCNGVCYFSCKMFSVLLKCRILLLDDRLLIWCFSGSYIGIMNSWFRITLLILLLSKFLLVLL